MGKIRQSNKETKKEAALSPKEKKAAKKVKKDTMGTPIMVPKHP